MLHLIWVTNFYFICEWMIPMLTLRFSKNWLTAWVTFAMNSWILNLLFVQCSQCLQENLKGVRFWYWSVYCWYTFLLQVVFCKKRRLCSNVGGGYQSTSQICIETFINIMSHFEEGSCSLTSTRGNFRRRFP